MLSDQFREYINKGNSKIYRSIRDNKLYKMKLYILFEEHMSGGRQNDLL